MIKKTAVYRPETSVLVQIMTYENGYVNPVKTYGELRYFVNSKLLIFCHCWGFIRLYDKQINKLDLIEE